MSFRRMPVMAAAGVLLAASAFAEISNLHPRVYVRHDNARVGQGITVRALRDRLKDSVFSRWRTGAPGQGVAATTERAARYLEAGSSDDLDAVRDFLSTRTFSYEKNDVGGFMAGAEMAAALDWVYHGLTPSEREAAMRNIVTTADSSYNFIRRGGPDINHNYTYMALNTVAVCGLVLHGEPEPFGSKAAEYLESAGRLIEGPGKVIDTWNAREGAWGEGSHYTFHETLRNLVLMLQAYRSASDTDYFKRIDMAKAGRFLIASTRPDFTFERVGDTSANRAVASLTVPLTVELLAAGVPEAEEAARLRSFSRALLEAYGTNAVYPAFGWGMRMYFEPHTLSEPTYRTLPLAMRLGAGSYEHIMFRNGWDAASTLITILAGDHYTDHQHFDKGHFMIYRRGGLAVDSGAYDHMYKPDHHANEYAPRTLAHNCLLVHDPAQQFPKGYGNDGGQNVLRGKQHHLDWPTYLAHREGEGLHTGEVSAYDAGDPGNYQYVKINLKKAYSEKITYYDRQFVYLPRRDFLVIFDRVSSLKPEFQKRWLLHFQERPEIDGSVPEAGVQRFAGGRLVTARRRGEFKPGGGLIQYDGVLFVNTLMPTERAITAIGGPGYEFYNAFTGTNYPVSRPQSASDLREAGTWRIEVAPDQPSSDDIFLHALQMAEGDAKPVETRLVQGEAVAGAQFVSARENQIVLFAGDRNGAPPAGAVTYRVTAAVPASHYVLELPPGKLMVVEANGRTMPPIKVNAQGVLVFRDNGTGARQLSIRPAP